MVLTYNGASNYQWAYPSNVTAPNLGTKIITTSFSYTVGNSTDAAGAAIVDGATVITTPVYPVGQGLLKVFIDGVRQDPYYDYAETTGKDGLNAWGKITFTGGGVKTGEQLLLEVDGYTSYEVNAVSVIFPASGSITSTNVQGAINTLDTNKMPKSGGTFTGDVITGSGVLLSLGASTTTAAAFRITAGAKLTTPVAGSIEFDGTDIYYTNASNTRKTFASTSYVDTAISTGFSSGSISAGTLTGTIPSAVLGNSTLYVGKTAIALNRASANLALTGITSIDGSAATAGSADKLTTSRKINGVDFDGSADITVTAAAGTLSGTVLKSTVVTSSLTSVGTLGSLDVTNNINTGTITTTNNIQINNFRNEMTKFHTLIKKGERH
jgi:hypothetical protein